MMTREWLYFMEIEQGHRWPFVSTSDESITQPATTIPDRYIKVNAMPS